MLGLQELHLQQTSIRGTLPPELGQLPFLMLVDVRNTLMTCCLTAAQADAAYAKRKLLPSYIEFSDSLMETPARLDNIFFNFTIGRTQQTGFDDPGINMQ